MRYLPGAAAGLALTACLAVGEAGANDRDLRAIHIPAFACHDAGQELGQTARWMHGIGGLGVYGIDGHRATLVCPLPLNNVELGGDGNDADMTSFTVFYSDADGRGEGASVAVFLDEVKLVNGRFESKVLCDWYSGRDGA